jgi:predicted nucleic acid-binding protein
LHRIRRSVKFEELEQRFHFTGNDNRLFLSIISVGEIESLAYQLNWGNEKWESLEKILRSISLLGIYEETIHAYARIDAYSQGKLKDAPLPSGITSRNMGKNDLWLAATAHVGNFDFVTNDRDFDHLDQVFLNVVKY